MLRVNILFTWLCKTVEIYIEIKNFLWWTELRSFTESIKVNRLLHDCWCYIDYCVFICQCWWSYFVFNDDFNEFLCLSVGSQFRTPVCLTTLWRSSLTECREFPWCQLILVLSAWYARASWAFNYCPQIQMLVGLS